jgi:hypothetical protein
MCVAVAKYFYDTGWVLVKNRDRNYIPIISFKFSKKDGLDRLIFLDDMTGYMEGMNINGVGILSTSLMVIDDEEVIKNKSDSAKSDGEKIVVSLAEKTAEKAAQSVVDEQLTGCTIIADQESCYLVEASIQDGKYVYDMGEIKQNQTVARTNHGIWLDWAGYQYGVDEKQDLSRKSSEARLKQAQAVVKNAKTPQDIIDGLCQQPNDDTQMNVLRTTTNRKMMRTTAQEMIIPIENTFYLRPIQSKLEFDFWKLNQEEPDMWVEILSNRSLSHPPESGMD